MSNTRRLWMMLVGLLAISFAVLLWIGREIDYHAPPVPETVVTESGETLWTRDDIEYGRRVWQHPFQELWNGRVLAKSRQSQCPGEVALGDGTIHSSRIATGPESCAGRRAKREGLPARFRLHQRCRSRFA